MRLGILGCGSFGKRRILPALKEINWKEISIFRRNFVEAQNTASEFNVKACRSVEELLNEVDAVFITSPNSQHKEDALKCAHALKPTLCEKPLALSQNDIQEMIEAFKTVPLLVGHSLRFKPSVHRAKELLGKIGRLSSMRIYFSIPLQEANWRWRKNEGGGVLFDIGVHLIDLIHFITEETVVEVKALGEFKEGTDVKVSALFRLSGGALVTLECGFEEPLRSGFELVGQKGKIVSTNSLRQTLDPVETLSFIGEDEVERILPLVHTNIYVEELKYFQSVLKGAKNTLLDPHIALENQKVIDQLFYALSNKERG